jgi:hypothetical protein
VSVSDVIALLGLAATVVGLTLGYAYKSGKTDARLDGLTKAMEDAAKETKEKAAEREARIGKVEDSVAVLFDFKARSEERHEERVRRDTRGIPVREDGE